MSCLCLTTSLRGATSRSDDGSENGGRVPLEGDGEDVEERERESEGEDAGGAGHGRQDSIAQESHVEVMHQGHQPQRVREHHAENTLARHHWETYR